MLRSGGNAVDAAVATGLAIGTVEPWMSGIGGGGYMTVYLAAEDRVRVVEFGMRAPFAAVPEDYPLTGGESGADTFNWPAVAGDANVEGPLSIAVPGYIKGISLALDSFGSMAWADVIEPACRLAEWGLPIDWYTTQKITGLARALNRFDEARRIYLADGFPPVANIDGVIRTLELGRLAKTFRTLQSEGPASYYTGSLADSIATDLQAVGSRITTADLADYSASVTEPLSFRYRASTVYVPGNLTAGPSLEFALSGLSRAWRPEGGRPIASSYAAYAEALLASYAYRLEHLGAGPDVATPTNTTHICVADADGNVVSLTQTIMSGFGSRVMLPGSGILMNNGMMWFDPRPGGPNSVAGGRRPLSNMCPVIVQADGNTVALGACGGRHIFPAVFQLLSFLVDYHLDVDAMVHQPRLDVSGTDEVTLMEQLEPDVLALLESSHPKTRRRPNGVAPNFFALPQVVQQHADGSATGGAFIPSPHAKVTAA
jgi:gamma-glutamyltranspeptidase/glutathione hydrolase